MLQCLNQSTFDSFEQCCIQCLLSQYVAQAKDHLTIIIANAVSSINEEIIPVFDTGSIIIAHLEQLTGSEQVNVNDLVNIFKTKAIIQKLTEQITCNDISAPCFSTTGFCTPLPVSNQLEVQLNYNISCFTIYPSTAFSGITSIFAPSFEEITGLNISSQVPPITQTNTQTITQTTTQTQVIQYICGVANECYKMLGIEIVDPADVYFNYQETPTGIVESAGFIEVAGSSDQLSLEEAPSQTTETESVEESISFVLSYLSTTTLPVLQVSFIYPITLIREVESVTATRSVQNIYFAYAVAKQTFAESVTATSVSVLGYFQSSVRLITQSEVTLSSQQILQIKLIKPISIIQSVPTSISQFIATLEIVRTVAPEQLTEYTDIIVTIADILVYQVITEILNSIPTSASQQILNYKFLQGIFPEITSSTQQVMNSQLLEVVKQVLFPEGTSSSQEIINYQFLEVIKQVVQGVLTSQTETVQFTYFTRQASPTFISQQTSQSEQVIDITFNP